MRGPLALLLVVQLASCPIVCGTQHSAARDGDEATHRHAPPGHSGLPAPANDDDCLCNGALKAVDAAHAIQVASASPLPDLLPPPGLLYPMAIASPERSSGDSLPRLGACNGAHARPILRC